MRRSGLLPTSLNARVLQSHVTEVTDAENGAKVAGFGPHLFSALKVVRPAENACCFGPQSERTRATSVLPHALGLNDCNWDVAPTRWDALSRQRTFPNLPVDDCHRIPATSVVPSIADAPLRLRRARSG
jgi:hypothetical protein